MSSSIDTKTAAPSPADGQKHLISMMLPQNYKPMQPEQQQPKHQQHLQRRPSQEVQHIPTEEGKKFQMSGVPSLVNSSISKYMPPAGASATENQISRPVQTNFNCTPQPPVTVNNGITNGPNQNSLLSNECNMNVVNSALPTVSTQETRASNLLAEKYHQQNTRQVQGANIDAKPTAQTRANPLALSVAPTIPTAAQFVSIPASSRATANVPILQSNPPIRAEHRIMPETFVSAANIPKYLPPPAEMTQSRIGLAAVNSQPHLVNHAQENYLNNNTQQLAGTNVYPQLETVWPVGPHLTEPTYVQDFSLQPQNQQQPNFMVRPSTHAQFPLLQYQNPVYNHQQQQQQQQHMLSNSIQNPLGVMQSGFNRLWGQDTVDLIQNRHILSRATLEAPKITLHNQFHDTVNCNPNILRCTLTKIPESSSLLQKSRLPLGIVIHPFRDINSLPVIQCPNIVRCRLCRTYINPFVYFVDSKMWKCNLCYRMNELPEDFQFDPATKTYGDVTRRPEVRSSTIEFIASSEYMLRPPQPAIYLFVFDVSIIAQQCGYLENICNILSNSLDDIPGGARTQVGFIAFNSFVHFYSMAEGYNQPHEITLLDIDDPFLPRPDNLLVNLKECKDLVKDLLKQLPKRFADTHDPGSALGCALTVAYKLMQSTGGRVTLFQTCLPNKGPGSLLPRENPNDRSGKDVAYLNPATDYYKRYALECSAYQIAVDLFLLNQQFSDLATISGISKHSGGCVHHFPLYQKTKQHMVESLTNCFKRYLVRKIGFEAVMRVRCTRGLQVHTFHGNFFVRSTDLLSLPNINPDAGYGMQISYEENLSDVRSVCFQAALLYTNSEGERRIRVHTLCLPVTSSLPEVMHSADMEAIVSLLSKMAVDRSLNSSVNDAREAFINVTVDVFNAFKIAQNMPTGQTGQLIAPRSLALLPLYILALLKHPAFRVGSCTRLDDRLFAMDCMKTLPLDFLMKTIYPELYNLDALFYTKSMSSSQSRGYIGLGNDSDHHNHEDDKEDDDDDDFSELMRIQLSAELLDSQSVFLMDCGPLIMIYVGINVQPHILQKVFDINCTAELQDYVYGLPRVPNSVESNRLERFIMKLNDEKPFLPTIQIIRDTSAAKPQFMERLVDDRSESSLSYYEFLQHIQAQVK